VLRRDDIGGIPWPGRIDLPGGTRDAGETPVACALRETAEEIGLAIAPGRVIWSRGYPGRTLPEWLVAARITRAEAGALRLGHEGQACWMMEIAASLDAEDAIPHQQARVREALAAIG
jgi:8-oxo-dGTP diphosphatase